MIYLEAIQNLHCTFVHTFWLSRVWSLNNEATSTLASTSGDALEAICTLTFRFTYGRTTKSGRGGEVGLFRSVGANTFGIVEVYPTMQFLAGWSRCSALHRNLLNDELWPKNFITLCMVQLVPPMHCSLGRKMWRRIRIYEISRCIGSFYFKNHLYKLLFFSFILPYK